MPDNQLIIESNPVRQPAGFEPQHGKDGTLEFERTMGRDGHVFMASKDGQIEAFGATTDSESTTGNGTFIAILKRVRTLLTSIFDAIVSPGAAIGTSKAMQVAGSDGTNVRAIKTASDGTVLTQLTGSILARDTTSGLPVELASETRTDGANILLVAEASLPDGSTAFPVVSGTGDVQGITAFATLRLVGFSITEDAVTPSDARVRLHHGTNNTGPELFDITLSPGESAREWFDLGGISVPSGVFVDRVSGTTRLTLYGRAVS